MRILIVEDEPAAAALLLKGLRRIGHAVDTSSDADDALYKLGVNDYDMLLLDIGLKGKSGLDVCREARAAVMQMHILMLTARDAVEDRIRGLDCGADDYLTKPYEFAELLARIRALERRGPLRHSGLLHVADLTLDLQARRASRGGRMLDLTTKEYALLEFLSRRSGHIVSRQEISEHVWDENYDVFSNLIEVYIKRLRRKIDDGAESPLIQTSRGQGYMIGLKSEAPAHV